MEHPRRSELPTHQVKQHLGQKIAGQVQLLKAGAHIKLDCLHTLTRNIVYLEITSLMSAASICKHAVSEGSASVITAENSENGANT